MTRSLSLRWGVQAAVATGGLAALSWEVIWQLQTSLSLGVSALGTALTLATTMAGMTVGSLAMGRFLAGAPGLRPLPLYGALEAVVGVSGLLVPLGFAAVESIDAAVYRSSPGLAPLLHVGSIVLLLGPATLALGATVPLFERIGRETGTSIARLYGINTAGAALGVLLLSFVLIPSLGITWSCVVVALANTGVLIATLMLDRLVDVEPLSTPPAPPHESSSPLARFGVAQVVVFGTGFVTFALEVAWFRSLRAAFWSTSESFAIVLASVLIPLAVASRAVPHLRARGSSAGGLLAGSAVAILLATPLVERADRLAFFDASYGVVLLSWFALSLLLLGPAILLLGVALPWTLEAAADPQKAGRLYAVNTFGAVVGSLAAAWLLLPSVGFARTAWLLGAVTLGLGLLASGGSRWLPKLAAGAISLAVAVGFTSSVGRDRVQSVGALHSHEILAFDEGPDSTITVIQGPAGVRRLLIDGFSATSESKQLAGYMEWMGHLPMLLHPDPKRALVICFGTGQTANAVRRANPEQLDLVDVDETVFELAKYFPSNEGVLDDPRVNAVVMDGRAWLRRVDRAYDVITLEPMPPYFAGVNALYSREFYEIMAARLAPGGVVAQWLPLHLLPPFYAASVVATFQSVFPDSLLWIEPPAGTGILLGRLAGGEAPLGERWPGLYREQDLPLSLDEILGSVELRATGMAVYSAQGAVITDDNQLLAYGRLRGELLGGKFRFVKEHNQAIIREIEAATAGAGLAPSRLRKNSGPS